MFERALRLSDLYSPFNIVSVVELESAPRPGAIKKALSALQVRQPLLRAGIELRDNRPCFVTSPDRPPPFWVLDTEVDRLELVSRELDRRIDPGGPLFRCHYITQDSRAALLLTIQHTIVDARSAAQIIHDLLTLAVDPLAALPALEVAPPAEAGFRPGGETARLLKFGGRQVADEFRYQLITWRGRRPPLRRGGHSHVNATTIDEMLTDSLAFRARREGVTLNSVLQASTLIALNRKLYDGKRTAMRTFTFPDLRPYLTPSLDAKDMSPCISMLRYTFAVGGDQDVWALARAVASTLQASFRRGDKYSAHRITESLMKLVLGLRSMRLGANGLSYAATDSLLEYYGDTRVCSLHGFVSSMDLGPELSTQAILFRGKLFLGMTYLDTDVDAPLAQAIADEVRSILERAAW